MASFISKVIGIILIFVMLVICPLVITSATQNIRVERITWNAITDYTDTVCDKGVITPSDYKYLISKLGATMVDYKVTVIWRSKMVLPVADASGTVTGYKIDYITKGVWRSDMSGVLDTTYLDKGDSVQIIIEPLSGTRADTILKGVLDMDTQVGEYSYSANVRNNGLGYVGN